MRGYPWAGSEYLWHGLAMKALHAGHAVSAVIPVEMREATPLKELVSAGLTVAEWRVSAVPRLEFMRERLRPNFSPRRTRSPDVLVVTIGSPTAVVTVPGLVSALMRTSRPFIVVLQFNADCLPISTRERCEVAAILRKAAMVVCVSRENRLLLERQFNVDLSGKHAHVHNPVLVDTRGPMPFPPALPLRLACVARLETYWKCQDILLQIMSESQWEKRGIELRLYGSGPDRVYLEERIERLRLTGRVQMMGHETDRLKIWGENHALVLPSRGEGTPLAALEAMMCGRPVVATRAGGLQEAVVDGLSGYLAQSNDLSGMRAVMERAYSDRAGWERMGLAGHLQARAMRDCDPAERLLGLIEAVAQSSSPNVA
jgi:glycosyltransferase involved in cell wall biosynthesis